MKIRPVYPEILDYIPNAQPFKPKTSVADSPTKHKGGASSIFDSLLGWDKLSTGGGSQVTLN